MKPRCLLSTVDRLPTISEMQESDTEDGDVECSSYTMEEYMDSIKELSRPAPYPLHGPLRGHRRWMTRTTLQGVTPTNLLTLSIPIELSDVLLSLTDKSNCETSQHFNQNLLDRLTAQSLFAGLV